MKSLFRYLTESENNYARAKREAIAFIGSSKSHWEKYKIGKAGETKEERYQNGYSEEYDDIEVLYTSKDPNLVSKMEKELIDEFTLEFKCQNEKDGAKSFNDKMTDRNDEYITYVVYKNEKK